jgi:serine/threonine protein kinase
MKPSLVTEERIIGNYRLLELVGSGGLGEVFRATQMNTGETVALKRLHDKYQTNKKLLGLFHKEIMIHSRVDHKHCVKFLEADLTPPNAHIVTNFIDGLNCHNLIRSAGAVPPIIVCAIMLDMLQGLEHLHCLDVIHSDLTPSNIMVERTGKVLLADFGLSCNQEFEDYSGMTVGTPGYQAPERLDHAAITSQSDIYGAGIIMYELLSGERLFMNLTDKETKKKMQNMTFSFLNTGVKEFDNRLAEILGTALAYKSAKRFPAAREFMFALYTCLRSFQVRYTRRAILQWLSDTNLTHLEPQNPTQRIYVKEKPKSI